MKPLLKLNEKKNPGLSQEPVFKSFYFHESTISDVDLF